MNGNGENPVLGRDEKLCIDALADKFERSIKEGESPRIEDFLNEVHVNARPAAMRELIKVEIELRRNRQESIHLEDYLGRFAGCDQQVLDACHQSVIALASDADQRAGKWDGHDTATFAQDDSVAEQARLEVRCPSCHAPVGVAVDTALTSLTCRACGSQFSLVNENDTALSSPTLATMGRFELISRVGMGAFGAVWKARDTQLDRIVALKIPRQAGMSAEDQEKFFREARAAAQLRHPNIVSVHEVGRDGDSIYIVSDFVRGTTLGDWLTSQKLSSREAAEQCTKIADALHHAHEQGVVHRDLKPANIMVDVEDRPHIMDFGLARREVGEISVTLDGHILGTPAYMSPEQAEGRSHAADRRSDVYSLGVILFQFLTGELPFRGNAGMIMHQVIHEEPPSPRKLNATISKDLETITLKCLEKLPGRRYQSAQELSQELRRFVAGEPIQARPVGSFERAWRWAKRRPAAAALLLVLVFSTAGFATAFVRERDLHLEVASQKAQADRQRQDANSQRDIAEKRKTEVESERDNAEAVVSFLTNDLLAKASPEQMTDKAARDTIVKNLIEPAAANVGQRFKDRPLVEAAVRNTLAHSLRSLSLFDLALPHAERALEQRRKILGDDHHDTIDALTTYGAVLLSLGRAPEAEPVLKQALALRHKTLGDDHSNTITSLNEYAGVLGALGREREAEPLLKQALEHRRKVLGEEHPHTIHALLNYASALVSLGRAQEAEPLLKMALQQRRQVLGENHPDTIMSLNNYAGVLRSLGRSQEAEPLLKQALDLRRKVQGEDHADTIMAINNYAGVLLALGRAKEAEPFCKQALETHRKVFGEDHPNTLTFLSNYAALLRALGRNGESLALHKEALDERRRVLGENHSDSIMSMHNYASALVTLGRAQEAEPLLKQTMEKYQIMLGDNHPSTINSLNNYAAVLRSLGRPSEAEPLLKLALGTRRNVLGEDHPDTIMSLHNYASVLVSLDRAQEAEPLLTQALERYRKLLGEDHPYTIASLDSYASALQTLKRRDEAEPLFKQVLERRQKVLGDSHPSTIKSLINYADVLSKSGRTQEAEPLYEKAKKLKDMAEH
jgi:tetratricopeptide (TPR) repeat protein